MQRYRINAGFRPMIPRLWLHRRSERTAHLECRLGGHLKDRESEFNPPRFRICSAHIELRMAQLRAIVGAAFCGVLACASRPVSQVHLALGTDPTSMNVEWYSEPGDILGDGSSVVQWGAAPTKLTSSANGTNVTMTDPDTARVYSFSVATMTGLDPGSTVFYRVGNPLDGWSSVYSFVATRTDFADVPLRVGVFGDLGWQNAQALAYLETEAASGNFDFVVRRNEGWGGGGGASSWCRAWSCMCALPRRHRSADKTLLPHSCSHRRFMSGTSATISIPTTAPSATSLWTRSSRSPLRRPVSSDGASHAFRQDGVS